MPTALFGVLLAACLAAQPASAQSEKDRRTPAQQKIDSQLLFEIYRAQGLAEIKQVPPGKTGVRIDRAKRAHVDLRVPQAEFARVTAAIKAAKGLVVTTHPQDDAIYAWIPLLRIEKIAAMDSVKFINAAAEPRR